MSDMDTLIAGFQTQLSDVMETILKTAMFEVTRLVEDGLFEQLKNRCHEVESLKVQLQLTESKLGDGDFMMRTSDEECHFNRGDDPFSASPYGAEDGLETLNSGVTEECRLKQEIHFMDHHEKGCGQKAMTNAGTTQVAEKLPNSLSLLTHSQEPSEKSDVVVKVEADAQPSCSVEHQEVPGVLSDGVSGSTFHSLDEMKDLQSTQTPRSCKELPRTAIRQNRLSSTNTFPEDQEDFALPLDMDEQGGLSLLQNHILSTTNDSDTALPSDSLKQMDHELMQPVSSEARQKMSHAGDVVIKQEIVLDSDEEEEEEALLGKQATDSAIAFPSCQLKNHKVRLNVPGHSYLSHRAKVQEVAKRHFKMGTGLALKATVRPYRPIRRPHLTVSSSAIMGHSPAAGSNIHHRTPSSFKSASSPHSPQPATLGNKQFMADSQNCLPTVSIKAQYQAQTPHLPGLHSSLGSAPQGQRHRCGQCGRCFADSSNLRAHLQTHTGERPFSCSLCGRSFTKLSNLKAHRRVHTGERPYCCMACGKGFTQKCNLKRHQRIHLNV